MAAQDVNGGWGGAPGVAPSIEETCQSVHGLMAVARTPFLNTLPPANDELHEAAVRGLAWISHATKADVPEPAPIGLYFAKLWYWERLYPLIGMASLTHPVGI